MLRDHSVAQYIETCTDEDMINRLLIRSIDVKPGGCAWRTVRRRLA